MADLKLAEVLNQQHPLYSAELPLWQRYRAFGEGLDTNDEKKTWLPRGIYEAEASYANRLTLTQDLGISPLAITRVKGALFRGEVSRDYEGALAERMQAFDAQAGGLDVTVEHLLEQSFEEAAKLGLALLFVGRNPVFNANNAASEELPFVEMYRREEAVDWDVDTRTGLLNWIVLRRIVSRRSGTFAQRGDVTTWLLCDRQTVQRFEQSGSADPIAVGEAVPHGLGLVPVVVHYGIRLGPMQARSYIDALSRADLRRLTLESDNANAASLHGNPRMYVRSSKPWDQIMSGSSRVMVLNPEDKEEAGYVTLDATGMKVMAEMIDAGDRRGAQLSGMDPTTFAGTGAGGAARSGAALQWAFQASEAPTLEDLYKGLARADQEIHELVARYMTAGEHPAEKRIFEGKITRQKHWDFLALSDLVDNYVTVKEDIPSPTWRKEMQKQIAARIPGNLPPETVTRILDEIEAAKPPTATPETPPLSP